MRKQRLVAAGITVLAASMALSACGSRAATGGSSASSSEKVATIGVIAPLSGDLSALGLGIRNSVDLAIRQANEKNLIPGWKLQMDAEDDQASPDVGKNAATKLAGDDTVVGVVGNLNSSVSQSTQPVLSVGDDRPDLAGQHRPVADQGRGLPGQPEAAVPGLLPDLHHGHRAGSGRRLVRVRARASPRSRPSTTRRHTARVWSLPSPTPSRRTVGRSSTPRRSTRTTRTSRR